MAFLALPGCGGITLGNTGAPNDPVPTGNIVAQGPFNGQNGKSVSGSATVYSVSPGNFVVRLDGLSAPVESGLVVVVVANGAEQGSNALRSSTGSQNYNVVMAGSPKWNKVIIRQSSNNTDYGDALLQ